jgi:RNA polymerase sigma factor (sigma-70 family)
MDDIELLREFASHHSEEAFRTVVERHLDFVYAVAWRQLGDAHAAEEVAQTVFIDLARKAAVIPRQTILSGWLFRAARFAAAKSVRSELRRQRREWEAMRMEPTAHENKMESPWEQMEPMLNEALEELSEQDRSAASTKMPRKSVSPAPSKNSASSFSGAGSRCRRLSCWRRSRRRPRRPLPLDSRPVSRPPLS